MRSILITAMLIITVVILYNNTVGGENGTKAIVRDSGKDVSQSIQSINP